MDKHGAADTLPSGKNYDDLMQELHEHLWQESTPPKKMTRLELLSRVRRGESLEEVRQTENASKGKPGESPPNEGAPGAQSEGDTTCNVGEPAQGNNNSGAGQSSGRRDVVSSNPTAPSLQDEQDMDAEVMVRAVMPESWVHRYSLLLCFFSRISKDPDPDLALESSNGPPPKKKARTSEKETDNEKENLGNNDRDTVQGGSVAESISPGSASNVTGSGRLSRRSVNMLCKVNESLSRRDAKKQMVDELREERRTKRTEHMLERFSQFCQESSSAETDICIQGLAKAVAQSAEVSRERLSLDKANINRDIRMKDIELKNKETEMFEKMGMADKAEKARREMVELIESPVVHSAIPNARGPDHGRYSCWRK